MEYFLEAWRQYANFSGRATRREFWWFVLIHSAVVAGLFLFYSFVSGLVGADGFASHPVTYTVAMLISAYLTASLPPALAITVRRLHDAGRRGWWILLLLVPVLGALALIVLLAMDSQRWRPNRWGPQPTGW